MKCFATAADNPSHRYEAPNILEYKCTRSDQKATATHNEVFIDSYSYYLRKCYRIDDHPHSLSCHIEPLIDLSQQVFNDVWYLLQTVLQEMWKYINANSEYVEAICLSKQSRDIAHYTWYYDARR